MQAVADVLHVLRVLRSVMAKKTREELDVGDYVFAKMKGYPAWPAQVRPRGTKKRWPTNGNGADADGRAHGLGGMQIIDPPEGTAQPAQKLAVYFFGTQELGFLKPGELEDAKNEALKKRLQAQHGKKKQWKMALGEMTMRMQNEDEDGAREREGEGNGTETGMEQQDALLELAVAAKEAHTDQEKRKRDAKDEANKTMKIKKPRKEDDKQEVTGVPSIDPQAETMPVQNEHGTPAELVDDKATASGPLPPDAQAVLHLKDAIRERLVAFDNDKIKSQKAEDKAEQAMKKALKLKNDAELSKKTLRQDARELEETLQKLKQEKVTIEVLEATNIGIAVKKWRKKELKDPILAGASDICKQILGKWMELITVSPKDSTMHKKDTESHSKENVERDGVSNLNGVAEVRTAPSEERKSAAQETIAPEGGIPEKVAKLPDGATQDGPEKMEHQPRPPSTPKAEKGETPGGGGPAGMLAEANQRQGDAVKPTIQERFEISTGSTLRDKGRKILKRHIQDIDKVGAGVRALELTMDLEQEVCKHLGVNAGEEPGRAYKLLVQAVCIHLDGSLGHKLVSGGVAPRDMVRFSTQFSR